MASKQERERLKGLIQGGKRCIYTRVSYDKYGRDTQTPYEDLRKDTALTYLDRFVVNGCACHCGTSVRELRDYVVFTESEIKPSVEQILAAYDENIRDYRQTPKIPPNSGVKPGTAETPETEGKTAPKAEKDGQLKLF